MADRRMYVLLFFLGTDPSFLCKKSVDYHLHISSDTSYSEAGTKSTEHSPSSETEGRPDIEEIPRLL
jgi:hypothetical protein